MHLWGYNKIITYNFLNIYSPHFNKSSHNLLPLHGSPARGQLVDVVQDRAVRHVVAVDGAAGVALSLVHWR
jgi:hypothetical protein